jgi:small conductance mechanosensitive channel
MQARAALAKVPLTIRRGWDDIFNGPELTVTAGKIFTAVLLGWIAYRVLKMVLRRIEKGLEPSGSGTISLHEQRARTLVGLVRSVGVVVIVTMVLFMVLSAVGVDLAPLLAGAGVVGLAFSFGAQSLVKDIISGLFILFENQFGVGDVIRVDPAVSGAVERMTLRVVVLRDTYGVVHIVPNGEIKRVSNLTRTWARAVLDVKVGYQEDTDRVAAVMREVGESLFADADWAPVLVEKPTVPGIESFADNGVVVRLMAKTVPLKQWDVARELRRRIKRRFDAEGISFTTPSTSVYLGEELVSHLRPEPAAALAAESTPTQTEEHAADEAM